MSVKHLISCAAAALLLVPVSVANAQPSGFQAHAGHGNGPAIDAVREALERYRDPNAALAAGYVAQPVCVSGPQEGAMGVHFVKPPLFDDEIDLQEPESDEEDAKPVRNPMVFINPRIVEGSDALSVYNEGCLSVPEQYAEVERPARIKASWRNGTFAGCGSARG